MQIISYVPPLTGFSSFMETAVDVFEQKSTFGIEDKMNRYDLTQEQLDSFTTTYIGKISESLALDGTEKDLDSNENSVRFKNEDGAEVLVTRHEVDGKLLRTLVQRTRHSTHEIYHSSTGDVSKLVVMQKHNGGGRAGVGLEGAHDGPSQDFVESSYVWSF